MANTNIKKSSSVKGGFFKRNWHIIVIVVLAMFAMSQCSRSCSRKQSIALQNTEMAKQDSVIVSLEMKIDTLKNSVNYYTALFESEKNHNSNFASIATGNQAELYGRITELENKNATLEANLKQLTKENKSLRDTIANLRAN